MVRRLLILMCCGLWLVPAWAAEFRASVDRSQVRLHEPVLLTLSLSNSDTRLRAQGVDPNVDLTLLGDDFAVGRPEATTNYNIFRGQGRSTSALKVEIFPNRSGTLIIPAFSVDGLSTEPIQLQVLAPDATLPEAVFLRSGADVTGERLWAGQQLVVWLDLYHRVELESASMGSNFETAPTRIELLPHWKLPQNSRRETIDGLDYEVERSAWAVFPSEAGPLSVALPDIWVTTRAGEKLRLPHQELSFEVSPLPAELPADIIVGKPSLSAQPLPADFTQYELSDWTLTLKAPVAVTTLPRQLPGVELPEGLKLFADPARYHTEKGVDGIMDAADYTLSIMPLAAGEFQLPTIRVPYFDPQRGAADFVELTGPRIQVAANPLPQPATVLDEPTALAAAPSATERTWHWPLATALMTALWLATLGLLWRQRRRPPAPATPPAPPTVQPREARHPLQQRLLTALGTQTLEQGLQRWRAHYPEDETVAAAVRAVQRLCYGGTEQGEREVQQRVDQALHRIRERPFPTAANEADPWRTESFTPAPPTPP